MNHRGGSVGEIQERGSDSRRARQEQHERALSAGRYLEPMERAAEQYVARLAWTLSHLPPGYYVDAAELAAVSDVLELEECAKLCGCSNRALLLREPQGTA